MNTRGLVLFAASLLLWVNVQAQTLGVVDRSEGLFLFLNLESEQITDAVNVGNFPHEVATDEQGQFAYIPDYGGNTVAIVNIHERTLKQKVIMHGFQRLHGVAVTAANVWITAEEQKMLVPLWGQQPARATGGYRSHMVTQVSGRDEFYVANMDTGTVSILGPGADEVVLLQTGQGSEGIDSSPDGRFVWVSNRQDNTISIIDTSRREVINTIPSHGNFPVKLVFRPDGKEVWVANNRSGQVAVFSASDQRLLRLVDTGERPLGITFSDDSRKGFVSRPGAGEILEIDTQNQHRIIRRIKVPDAPDGMIWIAD